MAKILNVRPVHLRFLPCTLKEIKSLNAEVKSLRKENTRLKEELAAVKAQNVILKEENAAFRSCPGTSLAFLRGAFITSSAALQVPVRTVTPVKQQILF